jgi:hypothetical protein
LAITFTPGNYTDEIMPRYSTLNEKTILHIPNVNSRESTKDKIREVEHIIEELGEWQGTDPRYRISTGKNRRWPRFSRLPTLVDDDPSKRDKVAACPERPGTQKT